MCQLETFLTQQEEDAIVAAIQLAEAKTSGEIRVHIEHTSNKPIEYRVIEVFHFLKMNNTKQRNGTLLYLATDDKQLAIYGDTGINKKVDANFWDTTKELVITYFKKGNYSKGIIKGVEHIGEILKTHFPITNKDVNELPNTISKL